MVHMMMNTIGLNYRNDLSRKFNRKRRFVFEKKIKHTRTLVKRSICSISKIRSIVLYNCVAVKFIDVISDRNAHLSRSSRISSLSDRNVSNS
jgi:hypothetical protein